MKNQKHRGKIYIKILLRFFLFINLGIFLIIGILRIFMILGTRQFVVSLENTPPAQAALVLGAGLLPDKTPSDPLRDRIDTAITLYRSGKVQKLLMSGDNRFIYYNEPEAMRQYALSQGVPDEDIVMDYAGRRTYDSCYRASEIFGLQEIIVVTQNYHLPRALFICNHLDVKATGIPSDHTPYLRNRYLFWRFREVLATLAAFWDVYIIKPLPVLGEFEPIFPDTSTWHLGGINLAFELYEDIHESI